MHPSLSLSGDAGLQRGFAVRVHLLPLQDAATAYLTLNVQIFSIKCDPSLH